MNLGAIDQVSAEGSIDVAVAYADLRVLMALHEELSKIDNATALTFRDDIQRMLEEVGELNKQLATLTQSGVEEWRASLTSVAMEAAVKERELVAALKRARNKRDLVAVGLTAGSILLAGWGGWYVFAKRRKKQFA